MPCIDFSSSGNRRGAAGSTGWLWLAAVQLAVKMAPLVIFSEMADNAVRVNGGSEYRQVLAVLQDKYLVHSRIVRVWDYGDGSHRKRLILCCFRKDLHAATVFRLPTPYFNADRMHTARDTAVPDSEVPEDHWLPANINIWYKRMRALPGEIMKIGRVAPGMGFSAAPHLMLAFEGTNNGPTTYGGGGTKPESSWSWGMPVLRRRLTTVAEYYSIASLSATVMLFHMQFFALLDSASSSVVFLRDCVNQGWPAASACAVDTAIAEHLEACGVASTALPRRQGCDADDAGSDAEGSDGYGTCNDADSSDSASDDDGGKRTEQLSRLSRARGAAALHREVGSGNPVFHSTIPTATASEQVLAAADTRDWTAPLHPNTKNQRRTLAGPMSSMEWAQMHFLMGVLNAAELETGTTLVYSRAVMHFIDFLTRYPLEKAFTMAHRATKAVFTAVWSSAQVEQVLLHFVLHEVAVRGNGWSSVRGKLYGIRHHNIRHGQADPLAGKLRLRQVMRALKKYRGPGAGKKPVDRALLLVLEKMLRYDQDDDDLVLWASTLTAWHFMMRSAEYAAKRPGGKFDLDRVVRVCDVSFYYQGVLTQRYDIADEVRITFGKQKCRAGGDVRANFAADHKLCVVKALATLFTRRRFTDPTQALFTWPRGSQNRGQGVRYADMVRIVKAAATRAGLDATEYSSHSMRKGGAQAYLLAGMSLLELKLQGRWKKVESLEGYIGHAVPQLTLLKRMQWKVARGHEDENVLANKPARDRTFMRWAAEQEAAKLRRQLTQQSANEQSGLGSVA